MIAVVSQANGLLTPLLGAVFLALNRRWLWAVVWLAVGPAAAFACMSGYASPEQHTDLLDALGRPLEVAIYALAFCGSAIGYGGEGRNLLIDDGGARTWVGAFIRRRCLCLRV